MKAVFLTVTTTREGKQNRNEKGTTAGFDVKSFCQVNFF